ncbi:MAG TPA: potassium transporter TrkG [Micromonosporaceae bacterium]|nr:potassium transporter TrkG [Micromonosporaceae bacterium]
MGRTLQHPARLVPLAFLAATLVGTGLLMLPVSRAGPGSAPLLTALFTATSATCVTGLAVVDTATYWSGFGEVVLLVLVQIGGLGIVAMATLLGLLVSRRLGLRSRLMAQAETRTVALGEVRTMLARIGVVLIAIELAVSAVLAGRFWIAYDYPLGKAAWYGLFHGVNAVNDAGFALYPDSLIRFVGDWWICLPIALAVIVGGLGFPVLFELVREVRRPALWSVHTRITVQGSAVLLAVGFVGVLAFEWANPRTFGPLGVPDKLLAGLFQAVIPRTAGYQTIDYASANLETIGLTNALMFIGGGSASTAGGIKVTTFFLLAYVIWSEVKGEADVVVAHRRISEASQRQALTVALLGVAVVAVGTLALIAVTDGLRFDQVLFEAMSAFSTTGLSMNVTPGLPAPAQVVIVILMYVGRVGTITAASALALSERRRLYRYPEERPIVG